MADYCGDISLPGIKVLRLSPERQRRLNKISRQQHNNKSLAEKVKHKRTMRKFEKSSYVKRRVK